MSKEELLKQLKEITSLLKPKENPSGGNGDDNSKSDNQQENKNQDQSDSNSGKQDESDTEKNSGKDKKNKDKNSNADQGKDKGKDKDKGKPKSKIDDLLDELENEINKRTGDGNQKKPDPNGSIEDPNGAPKNQPGSSGQQGQGQGQKQGQGQGSSKSGGGSGQGSSGDLPGNIDYANSDLSSQQKQEIAEQLGEMGKALRELEAKAQKMEEGVNFRGEDLSPEELAQSGKDLRLNEKDSDKTETQLENDARQLVANAIDECVKAGKDPGLMKRYLDFIEQDFPIWEVYLAPFFKQSIIPRYTYQTSYKNNITRASGGKIIMRGAQFEKKNLDHILFAIDVSGSISDDKLANFGSQVKVFLEKRKGKVKGITCFWDTRVGHWFEFNGDKSFVKEYHKAKDEALVVGIGGTSPDCLFQFAKEHDCKYIVVHTDGEFFSLDVEKWKKENFRCVIWSLWSKDDYKNFIKEGGNWPTDKSGKRWGKAST